MYKTNPAKASARDFLNAVINGEIDTEVIDFARDALAKIDKQNADRRAKPSKTALENAPIKTAIAAMLEGGKVMTAASIAANGGWTTQKVSSLCRQLVEEGVLTSKDAKVPASSGKGTTKCKVYGLAVNQ